MTWLPIGIAAISAASIMEILTGDNLVKATKRLEKSGGWKYQPQKFILNRLTKISELKKCIENGTYYPEEGTKFRIRENGHERIINAMTARDAVLQHALADEILIKGLKKFLIHDNGASLKGKGISFTRRRFEEHLRWHYRRHGTNGYVLMIDFRKYFDNIRHDKALKMIQDKIPDPKIIEIVKRIFETYEVDVSYSTDPDIESKVFNSFEYQKIPKELQTGKRFMRKSIGIGSQISQIMGIYYPTEIDNYCKTVKGIHCYDVYMDDRIIIHQSKEYLKNLLAEIEEIAGTLGIFINHKKTQIVKISHGFTWLKTRYILTDTGKVIKKIPRDVVTRERRKLKALSQMARDGEISWDAVAEQYKSWRGGKERYNAWHTLKRMDELYKEMAEDGRRE